MTLGFVLFRAESLQACGQTLRAMFGGAPLWDADRVTGFEVLPLALMDRPRIEVTLRVSGLFRDIFPGLAQLFEAGTVALAARDEPAGMNPYIAAAPGGADGLQAPPGSGLSAYTARTIDYRSPQGAPCATVHSGSP